ncbi:hypothetical protein AAFL31_23505 [Klebsiella huaxiensis]
MTQDYLILLQGQRDIAAIRANNERIAMQAHHYFDSLISRCWRY